MPEIRIVFDLPDLQKSFAWKGTDDEAKTLPREMVKLIEKHKISLGDGAGSFVKHVCKLLTDPEPASARDAQTIFAVFALRLPTCECARFLMAFRAG